MIEQYRTINKITEALIKEKGSKFIGVAIPMNDSSQLNELLDDVKGSHPNASHYCFAYLLDPENEVYRVNDDGEPSGSAGLPILGQIKSNELTNLLVVVVRYFGGTKLGVSGLKDAYKLAASEVLQEAKVITVKVKSKFELKYQYEDTSEVKAILHHYSAEIMDEDFQIDCSVVFEIPRMDAKAVMEYFSNKRNFVIMQL